MGISSFWLLWIKLLWSFMYKSLCGYIFSFLLDMKWMERIAKLSSKIVIPLSVLFTCPHHSLSTSLLFGPRCSRLFLHFLWPSPQISHVSKEFLFLHWRTAFRSQDLCTSWVHYWGESLFPGALGIYKTPSRLTLTLLLAFKKQGTRNSIATRKWILPTTWGILEASDDNANCQHHDCSLLRPWGKDLPKSSTDFWPTETKMINMRCFKPQSLW